MTTITVTFDPPLPSDSPATFNSKAFDTLGDLNTWSGQANTVAGEVNTNAANAATSAGTASTHATTATTQAGIATTQAGIATTQAGLATTNGAAQVALAAAQVSLATTQANTATTQAGTATTKASEADASAIAAAASAASIAPGSLLTAANPSYTGTLTGGTGIVNLGSGQFVKDSSGGVGIGTASVSSAKLTVAGDVGAAKRTVLVKPTNEATTIDSVRTVSIERAGNDSSLAMGYSTTRDAFVISSTYGSTGAYKPLVLATSDQDRVTVDTAGNFGLGVTPAPASLPTIESQYGLFTGRGEANITANAVYNSGWKYVNSAAASRYSLNGATHNWYISTGVPSAGNPISFTQAMTLDAGNLNVNTTGAAGNRFFVVQSGAGNVAARFQNSVNNYGAYNIYSVLDGTGNATTSCNHFVAFSSGADVFAVRGNGNVVNTNNSYGAISDLKLKENVTDASPKLAKLMQVRIVNYTLKADPTKAKLIGVIAQELEQISPGLIEETPDVAEVKKTREVEVPAVDAVLDDDGNEVTPAVEAATRTEEYTERVDLGTTTKSVKYSIFVPMLIKGMQEQQAQIEAMQTQLDEQNTAMQLLASRLAALEAA